MMDRNASSRMDHGAEGARAEWLAMQSLAEQIQKQQQLPADDPGADEHLHATPEYPWFLSPDRPNSSNRPSSRRPSSGWSRPNSSSRPSSSRLKSSSSPSSR